MKGNKKMNEVLFGKRTTCFAVTLAAAAILSTCCAEEPTIELEGAYPGHLQDVWMTSNTIW